MLGGAAGIRADGVADIAAIREAIGPDVPIMGIFKVKQPDGSLFITPSAESRTDGHRGGRPSGRARRHAAAASGW